MGRERMIEAQILGRGVTDPYVIDAIGDVPREAFVPPAWRHLAYDDQPLPIEAGQTISQPFIVALMIEAAGVRPGHRALDVGTGSGYAAAVTSRIAAEVYTIDRHAELVETARERFLSLGYDNIRARCGDGTLGWPEAAPFDAILVAACGPDIPAALREQLQIGGRLVLPVGHPGNSQRLVRIRRHGPDGYDIDDLGPVTFVPLIGAQGWGKNME